MSGLEQFYAESGDDPWGVDERWYEARKRALTLAVLPRARFARALEPGCSIGALTAELATRCDDLLAVDAVEAPLRRARARLAGVPHVRLERRRLPGEWPPGPFDLVVVSEVGYFLGGPDLADLAERAAASLTPDGVLVACHWRHGGRPATPGDPGVLTGDEVHAVLRERSGLAVLAEHVEEDFRLDVLVPPPATSVARAEGVLG